MSQDNYPHEAEFSFKNLLLQRKGDIVFLWKYRLRLIGLGITGMLLGALYAWYKPVTYTSKLTFVVEESKAGGGSLLSGLAGQLGFDLGGMSGTGSVLAGDNVQLLLKSRKMIQNTLLTPFEDDSTTSLADKYAESNKLTQGWEQKYNEGKTIKFPIVRKNYTRLQDSLLQVIVKKITEAELSVSKPDKKLTFFEMGVTMRNERVAQLFSARLIDEAARFYVDTKTHTQRTNINRLQARADSIRKLLNRQTYDASAASNILLDINPAYTTANVGAELKERDKITLQAIFSEIVKNLEVSRSMLAQETPTFQIVDEPELPLVKNRLGYVKAMFYGGFILTLLYAFYLLIFKRN